MMKKDVFDTAESLFFEKFSGARCGFAAGSVVRGEGTPASDIDVVIVYDISVLPKAYRETIIYQGWVVELFVQNQNSLGYFYEKDEKNGLCVLRNMVAEGLILSNEENRPYAESLKKEASERIEKGPPELSEDDADLRRYFISDLLDDLPGRNGGERMGILGALYQRLGDFYLRANGKWSGSGKALFRQLKKASPETARRYEAAFEKAYQKNDDADLRTLADDILKPFGGSLTEGYASPAPDEANKA